MGAVSRCFCARGALRLVEMRNGASCCWNSVPANRAPAMIGAAVLGRAPLCSNPGNKKRNSLFSGDSISSGRRSDGILKSLAGVSSNSPSLMWIPHGRELKDSLFVVKSFASSSAGNLMDKAPGQGNPNKVEKSSTDTEKNDDKMADMQIFGTLVKYLWAKDNLEYRLRFVSALVLLAGAKVINVQVPFLFKLAVDWLTAATDSGNLASFTEANSMVLALFVSPAAVLIGYGIARAGASACNELRTVVFSKVASGAIRSVSRQVFEHLHALDLRYHLRPSVEQSSVKKIRKFHEKNAM